LALVTGSVKAAAKEWGDGGERSNGDGDDAVVMAAFGSLRFDELLALEPRDDEQSPEWGNGGRFERWAERIGGAFLRTMCMIEPARNGTDRDG
jgi:hypothetical protein